MQGSSTSPSAASAPPSHSIDTPVQPQQSAVVPHAQQNNALVPMQLPAPAMQMPVPIRPVPVGAGAGGSVYYQQQQQQHPLHPQQHLHPQQLMHFPYAVSAVSTTTPSPVLTPPVNTLWLGDLPLEVDENFLLAVFGAVAAEIAGIKIIRHKDSRASLGYGFVEFRTHETAEFVLRAFDGQPLLNYPGKHLRMNWSLSGSSSSSSSSLSSSSVASFSSVGSGHAASAATASASATPSGSNATGSAASTPAAAGARAPTFSVWVGDLDHAVTDAALEAAFRSVFASTIGARIALDAATGRSRGYGFVKLADHDEAKAAVAKMNGFVLLARPMRVSIANANPKYAASSGRHTHAPVFQNQQSPHSHHMASGEGAVTSGPIVFSPAGSSSYVQLQQHPRQQQQQQQTAYAPQWVQAPQMHQLPPSATVHGSTLASVPVVTGASVSSPAAGAGTAAENERAQGTSSASANADGNSSNTTIFVGGLESHLSADYVHALFAPFGPLLSVKVPQGKNCGFVQFSVRADAEAALVALQSYDTGASRLRLDWGRSASKPRGSHTLQSHSYPVHAHAQALPSLGPVPYYPHQLQQLQQQQQMLHATSLQSYGAPNFIGGSYAAYAPALNGGGAYGSVGMVGQAGGGGGGGGMMPVMGPMGQQIYSMVGVDGSGNIQWQAQQQPQIQPQAQQLPQPQQQPMLMGYYVVQQPQQQLQPQQHLLQRPVSSAGPANNSDVAKPDATSDQNPSNHSSQSENGGEGARN